MSELLSDGFIDPEFEVAIKLAMLLKNPDFGKKTRIIPSEMIEISDFFSIDQLHRCLEKCSGLSENFTIIANLSKGNSILIPNISVEISQSQIWPILEQGATVCFRNLHTINSQLNKISIFIKHALNFNGISGVNCYLSTHDHGFGWHYDARIATSVQISGKKKWWFHRTPSAPDCTFNGVVKNDTVYSGNRKMPHIQGPNDKEVLSVELASGDLLSIPCGTWHCAQSLGTSLALNFYFEKEDFHSNLIRLIQEDIEVNRTFDHFRSNQSGHFKSEDYGQAFSYFSRKLKNYGASSFERHQ